MSSHDPYFAVCITFLFFAFSMIFTYIWGHSIHLFSFHTLTMRSSPLYCCCGSCFNMAQLFPIGSAEVSLITLIPASSAIGSCNFSLFQGQGCQNAMMWITITIQTFPGVWGTVRISWENLQCLSSCFRGTFSFEIATSAYIWMNIAISLF